MKPYILVVVSGGVAYAIFDEKLANVDILDYDNLRAEVGGITLTKREAEYLQENDFDFWKKIQDRVKISG